MTNSSADSPRPDPISREKRLLLSSSRPIATVVTGKRLYRGLSVRAPIAALNCLRKGLFCNENYERAGFHVIRLSHTAAASIACFLRNTFLKTAAGAGE
jgi:hypothetical protein